MPRDLGPRRASWDSQNRQHPGAQAGYACRVEPRSADPSFEDARRQATGDRPPDHLRFFRFAGRFVAKALRERVAIPISLSLPLLKHVLGVPLSFSDLEFVDAEAFQSRGAGVLAWPPLGARRARASARRGVDYPPDAGSTGPRRVLETQSEGETSRDARPAHRAGTRGCATTRAPRPWG